MPKQYLSPQMDNAPISAAHLVSQGQNWLLSSRIKGSGSLLGRRIIFSDLES